MNQARVRRYQFTRAWTQRRCVMLAVIVSGEQLFQRLDPSGTCLPGSPRSGFSLAAEGFLLEHDYLLARYPDALVSKPSDKSEFPFLKRGKLASDLFRLAENPGLDLLSCFGPQTRLAISLRLCNSEYTLIYRGSRWLVPRAKTGEMRSLTPRPSYLRSAVLALLQRQRYQNTLASPRELCLRTSRLKMI